ncbi:helix-turn-helix transcriptional regulator [Salisediminibacterium beveridgei]|uniref:Transcriptional regulator, HTH-XRE superfamily n=1 Tax=Salisediminibacterium beveridgei TaxID=632773 RepID=A0A1D7QRL2_9BACI|nr:helix-turn-helix transcriptional regulator [Salisediminibacterium beveridgei]AOM81630.1 transcriptional regulator, HTH-XRE superfamily [Salisediminibacterium beveridgei]
MSDFFKKYADIADDKHVNQLRIQGYLAAEIKKRRQELEMSQQNLADKISKPKSTIGRIEAGLNSPNLNTLCDISMALDLPLTIDGRAIHQSKTPTASQ